MATKKKIAQKSYDVIVVGGGLAGLTMTALIAGTGRSVLCLDRDDPQKQRGSIFDARTTAISYGSRKVLEAAGIWDGALDRDACPIETIHIRDGDSPVLLNFSSAEVGGRIFGWIFENHVLRAAMMKRLAALSAATHAAPAAVTGFSHEEDHVVVHTAGGEEFRGSLVIGADGRQSFTREQMDIGTRQWSYKQRAIVCNITHEKPHNNIAVENFRASGPFAVLPMTDSEDGSHRSSIVWTEHGPEENSALHWDQDVFNTALNARLPEFYGVAEQVGGRAAYPLGLIHAHRYTAPRMALVADAAHGMHPIAGQGLNMGLRDIAALASLIAGSDDPGAPELLARYQRQRRFDNMAMMGVTDSLNRLFSNDLPPVRLLRRTGLRLVSALPPAKRFFMNQAMGAAGFLPALIREAQKQDGNIAA